VILPDVNVLVYAHRTDVRDHGLYAEWLTDLATRDERFAMSELVLSGFIRIVTNPAIFPEPTPLTKAVDFVEQLLLRSTCLPLRPGPRHWAIFTRLCHAARAQGKLVADAYHAALAIEYGCEFATTDGDFARFPELRWKHPLR